MKNDNTCRPLSTSAIGVTAIPRNSTLSQTTKDGMLPIMRMRRFCLETLSLRQKPQFTIPKNVLAGEHSNRGTVQANIYGLSVETTRQPPDFSQDLQDCRKKFSACSNRWKKEQFGPKPKTCKTISSPNSNAMKERNGLFCKTNKIKFELCIT